MAWRTMAAVTVLAIACGHGSREVPASSPTGISLPSPGTPPGFRVPPSARLSERDLCVDRQLNSRQLNAFGDPEGTTYPEGQPLGVRKAADRYEYVLKRHPDIASSCTRAPNEPER